MTESQDQASTAALTGMKLPQLQKVAAELGLKGTSRLRKGELIEAIRAHSEAESGSQSQRSRESDSGRGSEAQKQQPQQRQRQTSERGRSGGRERQGRSDGEGPQQDRARSSRDRSGARGQKSSGEQALDVFAEFETEAQGRQEGQKVSTLDDIQLPRAEDEDTSDANRRRRGRDRRDRKRRPGQRESQNYDEVEVTDADVLIPIAGVLDILDNYAFVRTTGYLPGSSDVYVNLGMVRRHGLRRGDAITGAVRQPREGETSNRQKFNALVAPEQVNNAPATESEERPEFETLTATYPQKFISLGEAHLNEKMVDVLAPVAMGQRVLVSCDAGVDRLSFLKSMAQGIAQQHPHVHLMMVLIDERPEDATHLQRGVHGEVIASSFDRSGNDHTTVAGLAVERAKRLVELGQDVVVILDSLTALARAHHTSTSPSSRVLEHGLDAATVHAVKQLFGAGRSIENGGSLTLVATGVRGTDAGDFLLDELRAVANSHISLVPGPLGPTLDAGDSHTRNLEAIFDIDELAPRLVLRRLLDERDDPNEWLVEQLATESAQQFLAGSVKVTPREKAEIRRTLV